jgi:hypothetical protein
MSLLASIRPDSWNVPLFLHVLGAMVLVGGASTGAIAGLVSGGSVDPGRLHRLAFRSLLVVALPAYVVMRIGAEWLYSKEFGDVDEDPTWIGIGYITADAGALLLVIAIALAGFATRSQRPGLSRASGVVLAITTIAWLVAVWAMGSKVG